MTTRSKILSASVKYRAIWLGKAMVGKRIRWVAASTLLLGTIFVNMFGLFGSASAAVVLGQTYTWVDKWTITATGGMFGSATVTFKDSGENQALQPVTNILSADTKLVYNNGNSQCAIKVTLNVDAVGRNEAKVATSFSNAIGLPNCGAGITAQLPANTILNNVPASTLDPGGSIPMGCPGGPLGPIPTSANYTCPGGGVVAGGVYYAYPDVGEINGHVKWSNGTTSGECASTPITITRITGGDTLPGSSSTGGSDGSFVLNPVSSGTVTLSVSSCKGTDGTIYSGSSPTVTVKEHAVVTQSFTVSTVVTNAGGANGSNQVCDNVSFTDINFFVCGFIGLMSHTASSLDDAILSELKVDTETIFNDDGKSGASDAYFKAWAAFRNIAYSILVILALVMIVSQVMGIDAFDAYTIRKMLPRLIIAVIFIALSWNIMDILFNLSNDAADAGRAIVAAPFSNIDVTIGNSVTQDITIALILPGLLTVGVAAGVAALAILGLGGIAALIGTIILAVFSAWVLIVGRNVVATMLIISSPIAIISWALGR